MGIPRLFGIRHGKRMSTHWSLAQWKKLIGMVIWIGVNSSQRFLKSPCDCASSCRVCVSPGWSSAGFGSWLCAACTPVDGMNRRGAQEGWGEEEERKKTERGGGELAVLADWLAPATKQRPCLINNPKQTGSNEKRGGSSFRLWHCCVLLRFYPAVC